MKTNTLLYNKYRPVRFDEVGGNANVTEVLKNMVANKEVANSHFIFSGCVTEDTTIKIRVRKSDNTLPIVEYSDILTEEDLDHTLQSIAGSYYVYEFLEEDGTPYYVGKGLGLRIKEHLELAQNGITRFYKYLKSKLDNNSPLYFRIDSAFSDSELAYSRERELQLQYGRVGFEPHGTLLNKIIGQPYKQGGLSLQNILTRFDEVHKGKYYCKTTLCNFLTSKRHETCGKK